MRCQGVTKSGKPCSRPGPWCPQHRVAVAEAAFSEHGPNRQAVEVMIARLGSSPEHDGALSVPEPVLALLRTLADDMDAGEEVSCPKCKTLMPSGHNAALVKQYRELVASVGDDTRSPLQGLFSQIHNASSAGAPEPGR